MSAHAELLSLFRTPAFAAAFRLLGQARSGMPHQPQDPWDGAVAIDRLYALGLSATDLRTLVAAGYARHAEKCQSRDGRTTFRPVANRRLSARTCFVLTETDLAQRVALRTADGDEAGRRKPRTKPHWDARRRELRVGRVVVKRFKQPAACQILILSAFEEEAWPARLDDPLPPQPGQDAKRRLHATICNLNRHCRDSRLHFEGGGDGRSIAWRLR